MEYISQTNQTYYHNINTRLTLNNQSLITNQTRTRITTNIIKSKRIITRNNNKENANQSQNAILSNNK